MNNGKMKKILACGLFLSALAGTQALELFTTKTGMSIF